jgi:Cu+-exporting ATPase
MTPSSFESSSGIGVRGVVNGERMALGNTTLMESEGVSSTPLLAEAEALRAEGASVMYLARNGVLWGC